MSTEEIKIDGLVLYADGSYRQRRAGWGVHGYAYVDTPLTRGIGIKQFPTKSGYQTIAITESVTVDHYIDAFGPVTKDPTNNTGELQALIEALTLADTYDLDQVLIFSDSKYVINGFTKWMERWSKSDWTNKEGHPVENIDYWKELEALKLQFKNKNKKITLEWVKGHSGNTGNDLADYNARTGSGLGVTRRIVKVGPERYHNPTFDTNPLIMKSRMLFNIGGTSNGSPEKGYYYYIYQLGRSQTYGHKQGDTAKDRHDKSDLLLGRRISDATFSVLHLDEPDEYLEMIKELHINAHQSNIVELAVARLDTVYRPMIQKRIQQFGVDTLSTVRSNKTLVSPYDDLVSKTLDPPRLALEAVDEFSIMQRRLDEFITGGLGKAVTVVDITSELYGEKPKGKSGKTEIKLHDHITTATLGLDIPAKLGEKDIVLKYVLGVDIPQRNTLARLASESTRVAALVVANGPHSYTFATAFDTPMGRALYQSPYSQFVIPKTP